MNMKPQDLLVSLKIFVLGQVPPYAVLAPMVGMSLSGTHDAVKRAGYAGLLEASTHQANKSALAEFIVHGVKYAFPVQLGSRTRGIPTSFAAEPLKHSFDLASEDIPVWPHKEGSARGYELKPLCRSAPEAALADPQLYEWLALVDAVRSGRARERELAVDHIRKRLGQ